MEKLTELKLTSQEVALVVEALSNMPLGRSINVFLRIQQQIAEQTTTHLTPAQAAAARNGAEPADDGR